MPKVEPKVLKAAVLGANDGIITTFAVVAGVVGAGLPILTIIVLGIANMIADGISMALGDYLGEKSVQELNHETPRTKRFWRSTSVITFLAFIVAALLPLIPYLLPYIGIEVPEAYWFPLSIASTALALFTVGSLRTLITKNGWWKSGLEMLGIGALAAAAAYFIGALLQNLTGTT